MLTLTRDTKRLTIIVIYIFLFLGIGTGLYFWLRPAPTCFDGKQNQDEQGIDCGGVCSNACLETVTGEPLIIREVTALPIGDNTYDVVGKIYNPNNTVGAASFTYTVRLLSSSGVELGQVTATGWVLPQETKNLLVFALPATEVPSKATLEITDVKWERLSNYDGRPKLGVYNKRYEETGRGGEYGGVASGLVTNESGYDYRLVTVKVIARDAEGKPLAINQTDLRTFLVGQQRDFRLPWPQRFSGTIDLIDVEVDADVYHSDNFLRRYLPASSAQTLVPGR